MAFACFHAATDQLASVPFSKNSQLVEVGHKSVAQLLARHLAVKISLSMCLTNLHLPLEQPAHLDCHLPKQVHHQLNALAIHGQAMHAGNYLWCSDSIACLAVSGESAAEPGAFLTGANSESRATSMSATRWAIGKVSKMNSSSFTPCNATQD